MHASFGHYVVCSFSIYGFWLPLWYLQNLLEYTVYTKNDYKTIWAILMDSIRPFNHFIGIVFNTMYTIMICRIVCHVILLPTAISGRLQQQLLTSRFKIFYSHKPMHYNGTEINTNFQYQYLHAHDKRMVITQ